MCKDKATQIVASATPEVHLHTLRSLLNYHERMMLPKRTCPAGHCDTAEKCEGKCPNSLFIDYYAEALKEAIRCIEIVHKEELTDEDTQRNCR